MRYNSLPIERQNAKIPQEYLYLTLVGYPEDYLINVKYNDGSKISKSELESRKLNVRNNKKTRHQLGTGTCNLYNNKIQLGSICDSYSISDVLNYANSNSIIYKIKPLSSYSVYEIKPLSSYSVYEHSQTKYYVSEFNVIKVFACMEDILLDLNEEYLIKEFSANVFCSLNYANAGYDLKLYDYFRYIKENFPSTEIFLTDIILEHKYKYIAKDIFRTAISSNIAKENIKYLLDNNLITYIHERYYDHTNLIIALIECGLSDIALKCVNMIQNIYEQQLTHLNNLISPKDKILNITLKKWINNLDVKEIVKTLGITIDGVKLIVRNKDNGSIIKEQDFNNIGEVKTFLVKQFDISFEDLCNKDVCDITIYETDNYDNEFEIGFELE